MSDREVVIVSAVRTPIGNFQNFRNYIPSKMLTLPNFSLDVPLTPFQIPQSTMSRF